MVYLFSQIHVHHITYLYVSFEVILLLVVTIELIDDLNLTFYNKHLKLK